MQPRLPTRNEIVVLLLVANLLLTASAHLRVQAVDDRVDQVAADVDGYDHYVLANEGGSAQTQPRSTSQVQPSRGTILVYDSQRQEGRAVSATYRPLPSGEIYIRASDITIAQSFQHSVQTAQTAVQNSKFEPAAPGIAISIEAPQAWEYLRGESAGLTIAAEIAATDPQYRRNRSVALTGAVRADGGVVSVDYIAAKARAAREAGKTLLVAPPTIRTVDIPGIKIVQVRSLEQALKYALVRR